MVRKIGGFFIFLGSIGFVSNACAMDKNGKNAFESVSSRARKMFEAAQQQNAETQAKNFLHKEIESRRQGRQNNPRQENVHISEKTAVNVALKYGF